MMPTLVAVLFTLLLVVILSSSQPAGAADGGITFTTDKLVYHPGDTALFTLVLDSSGQSLSGDLVLTVYPAASLTAPDVFSQVPLSVTEVHKDYSFSGEAAAAVSAEINDLKVGTGGFPVKVSLM